VNENINIKEYDPFRGTPEELQYKDLIKEIKKNTKELECPSCKNTDQGYFSIEGKSVICDICNADLGFSVEGIKELVTEWAKERELQGFPQPRQSLSDYMKTLESNFGV